MHRAFQRSKAKHTNAPFDLPSIDNRRHKAYIFTTIFVKADAAEFALLREKGKLLTEADYEAAIRHRLVYEHNSFEQAKKHYTIADFMRENYAEYCIKFLDAYVAEFKKVMNP